MTTKWVYLFSEVKLAEQYAKGDWETVRGLLGGKGANLADMTRIGIPVPSGFTVTTEACNAYLAAGMQFPEGAWEQVLESLKAVEEETAAPEESGQEQEEQAVETPEAPKKKPKGKTGGKPAAKKPKATKQQPAKPKQVVRPVDEDKQNGQMTLEW